ncbi:MAG: SsrA-binding protein SmpB [Patescibacteria group bacterium]|nr:SsrA-binding protein SmpB [Patescibacteria group bacterium]
MNKKPKVSKREFYNKKARFDYQITDSLETGIALTGEEIKAIRANKIDMTGSYAKILNGEVFWIGANINIEGGDRQRTRKLLLHRSQIDKLIGKTAEQGFSLIPLKLYLTKGKAKLELGIGKGMKKYEKREKLKTRDIERDININLKDRKYNK